MLYFKGQYGVYPPRCRAVALPAFASQRSTKTGKIIKLDHGPDSNCPVRSYRAHGPFALVCGALRVRVVSLHKELPRELWGMPQNDLLLHLFQTKERL